MGLRRVECGFILAIHLSLFTALSASTFTSEGQRLLLDQTKKPCPVNFEFQNYTIITSKCKGPQYPRDQCCSALIEFACQFAGVINDMSNDCADTMFSYINLYGKYPSGLFASLCLDGKQGLECPAISPSAPAPQPQWERSGGLSPSGSQQPGTEGPASGLPPSASAPYPEWGTSGGQSPSASAPHSERGTYGGQPPSASAPHSGKGTSGGLTPSASAPHSESGTSSGLPPSAPAPVQSTRSSGLRLPCTLLPLLIPAAAFLVLSF